MVILCLSSCRVPECLQGHVLCVWLVIANRAMPMLCCWSLILTDQRISMSPKMLEVILYLCFNPDMWDVATVAETRTQVSVGVGVKTISAPV